MKRETKLDIIELGRGYFCVLLMSWWGFWSIYNYNNIFVRPLKFLTSLGGIL